MPQFSEPFSVAGVLEPSDPRGGVAISGIKAGGLAGVRLPQRFRLYNGPDGELDIDLGGPVKLGPFQLKPAGRYSIF